MMVEQKNVQQKIGKWGRRPVKVLEQEADDCNIVYFIIIGNKLLYIISQTEIF